MWPAGEKIINKEQKEKKKKVPELFWTELRTQWMRTLPCLSPESPPCETIGEGQRDGQ